MKNAILHKDFKFSLESVDEAKGTFTGYASVFGVVDSYLDCVDVGAFKKTIKENDGVFPMLDHHNVTAPIGVIHPEEDKKGLKVLGELNMDVQRARELRSLAKQGAIGGLSIGYEVVKEKPDKTSGIRYLKEIKLWEISLVTFPACPGATVEEVKDSTSALPTDEPPQGGTPPEPEPPSDSDLGPAIEAAKSLNQTLRDIINGG
jgi:HK97 family phage prohead protease